MALFEDLQWMEDELIEEDDFDEEEEYEEQPLTRRERRRLRREEWKQTASMDYREAVFVEKKRYKNPNEKGIGGLKFLAFLEFLAILAVIWGWIKWLY
mgnify:CR=1 FL=1